MIWSPQEAVTVHHHINLLPQVLCLYSVCCIFHPCVLFFLTRSYITWAYWRATERLMGIQDRQYSISSPRCLEMRTSFCIHIVSGLPHSTSSWDFFKGSFASLVLGGKLYLSWSNCPFLVPIPLPVRGILFCCLPTTTFLFVYCCLFLLLFLFFCVRP